MHHATKRGSGRKATRAITAALLVLLLGGASAPAQAQAGTAPCRTPEFAQFDFWLGDWTVRWTDKDKGEQTGRNHVRKTLDGCVILEQFDGRPGSPLQGTSVSTFDSRAGQWKQTWVDNSGGYLDFEGGFRDGRMILSRRAALAGAAMQQRMIFSEIEVDSLTWDWQTSKDNGATWSTTWRLRYTRRQP